jgi:hypothetical protein
MPHLFSYGTLQQKRVQRATFGRYLTGQPDTLVGYRQSLLKIDDPEVEATSGESHHPIVVASGQDQDRIPGVVFEVSDHDLIQADLYEVSSFRRVEAVLASGTTAWVYVDGRSGPR